MLSESSPILSRTEFWCTTPKSVRPPSRSDNPAIVLVHELERIFEDTPVSLQEVADTLGVPRQRMLTWLCEGELPEDGKALLVRFRKRYAPRRAKRKRP